MHVRMFLLYNIFQNYHKWLLFLNDGLFRNNVSPIFVLVISRPILDIAGEGGGGWGNDAFFQGTTSENRALYLLVPTKQITILTISNEIIFFKTQGIRLGVLVARNEGLE